MSPSRSSMASCAPVEAPEGTPARPSEPSSRTTSTSTVGLPRLSRISRPMMSTMAVMDLSSSGGKLPLFAWLDGRSSLYHRPPKAGKHAQDGRMSKTGELAQDEIVSRRSERRIVILATSFGFLMFLVPVRLRAELGPGLARLHQSVGIDDADHPGRQLQRRLARVLRLQPLLLRHLPAADHRPLARADAAAGRHRRLPAAPRPQAPTTSNASSACPATASR